MQYSGCMHLLLCCKKLLPGSFACLPCCWFLFVVDLSLHSSIQPSKYIFLSIEVSLSSFRLFFLFSIFFLHLKFVCMSVVKINRYCATDRTINHNENYEPKKMPNISFCARITIVYKKTSIFPSLSFLTKKNTRHRKRKKSRKWSFFLVSLLFFSLLCTAVFWHKNTHICAHTQSQLNSCRTFHHTMDLLVVYNNTFLTKYKWSKIFFARCVSVSIHFTPIHMRVFSFSYKYNAMFL